MAHETRRTTSSTTQDASQNKITKLDKFKVLVRFNLMMIFEIALPFALHAILKNYMRETWALLISCAPPFIIIIYGLIRRRRADVIGVVLIICFIVDAALTLLKDGPWIQLIRKFDMTATVSAILIISLIPIKLGTFQLRPLAFYLIKDCITGGSFGNSNPKVNLPGLTEDEPSDERWNRYWVSYQYFRRGFTIITVSCGFGLLIEIPIRIYIMYKLSSNDKASLYSDIFHYVWSVVLGIINSIIFSWMKKKNNKIVADGASATDKPLE
jgi:hypothetical protein